MGILEKKTLLLVTGASRGIGKQIALDLSPKFSPGSVIVLVARNEEQLREIKQTIIQKSNDKIDVRTLTGDLNEVTEVCQRIKQVLENIDGKFENSMLVHNAGTLGDVAKHARKLMVDEINSYMQLNFTSMVALTGVWMDLGLNRWDLGCGTHWVINITSLLAVKGIPSLSLYASGKAAREGFMRVLAEEEPCYRILNYSPGPVITDMQHQIQNQTFDQKLKTMSLEGEASGKFLTCEQTIEKMLALINKNEFQSGTRIDYYDPQ